MPAFAGMTEFRTFYEFVIFLKFITCMLQLIDRLHQGPPLVNSGFRNFFLKGLHQFFRHYSNTPVLQHVAPKSHLSVTKGDTPKSIVIESYHDGLLSFGL